MTAERHQQVFDLFMAASRQPTERRIAWVDEACGGDDDLRSELLALLEHHDPGTLIRDDGTPALVELLELPLRAVPEDRYEITGEVARGGMGVVLRARDNEIGRMVAIKVLQEELVDSPGMLTRFIAEAQIAGQLQHPGIAPVYEVGELPDGRPFFAMKLVDGQSFADILDAGSSTQEQLVGMFERICQSVAYAHARGVIHRDLKPANVIVGQYGQVQVLDWGLAKVLSGDSSGEIQEIAALQTVRSGRIQSRGDGSATLAGTGMGTIGYASPEQATGDFAKVDRRADVFGLGAILCEILTGAPAVPQTDAGGGLSAARHGSVELSARLEQCDADLLLVGLVRDCLKDDPDDRPPDADAVACRISDYQQTVQSRLQEAELVAARAETRTAEERKRRLIAVGLVVTAAVLCITGVSAWAWIRTEQQQREIESQRRANLVMQSINDALRDAVRLREVARSAPLTSVEPWMRALEAAQRAADFAGEHPVDRKLQLRINLTLAGLKAETTNRRFLAEIEAARIQPDNAVLHTYNNKAMAKRFTVAFRNWGVEPVEMTPANAAAVARRQSGEHLAEIVAIANQWWLFDPRGLKTKDVGKWVRRFVDELDPDEWRSAWRYEIGRTNKNRDAMLKLVRAPGTLDRPVSDIVNLAQGMLRTRKPWIGEIVAMLQKAERLHPKSVWIKYWLVDYSARLDSPAVIQQGLRYSQSLLLLHPTAVNRVLHAKLLKKAGAVQEAEVELLNVLASHPRHVAALEGMAQVQFAMSNWQETLDFLDQTTAAATTIKESGARPLGLTYIGLGLRGQVFMNLGQYEDAVQVFQRQLEGTPVDSFRHYRNLGKAWLALGDGEKAVQAFKSVQPKDGRAWLLLGKAYLAVGSIQPAESAIRSAIDKDPTLIEAYYLLAGSLAKGREWAEAIEIYRTVFARDASAKSNFSQLAHAAKTAAMAAADPSGEVVSDIEQQQWLYLSREWLEMACDCVSRGDVPASQLTGLLADDAFTGMRDESSLADVPAAERDGWEQLWQNVAKLQADAAP